MNERKETEPALCFVPEMLAEYVHKSNIRILEPASFFIHGVCLLVDISGFTKLSGQFCDQGKAGIDDLQLATNGFMEQLVEIIYKFGGDIIKFAGDAIICVFSADFTPHRVRGTSTGSFESFAHILDGHVDFDADSVAPSISINNVTPSSISAEVILRVMHCAKLLTDVQTDKLTVHVAMSCGEICFGILGGFENRWECLISGTCIHQLSGCLDDAPSKHAVISHKCARTLKDTIPHIENGPRDVVVSDFECDLGKYSYTMLPLPSGNCRIISVNFIATKIDSPTRIKKVEVINEDLSVLVKQFVPVPIADQLDRGASLHYMAEIREVTTMFMKWDSYDENTKHRDLLELQPCFFQAQRILASTGAYLRQFLVDDKGCVLIACWGMPHLSYLDNAHRALTAAAQIRIACYQLEMNCSFGITTGDVYCGTVGSALRMEYAAIGSCVNMSARLMGKANGGILIDDATFDHLPPQDVNSVQKMKPIKVKGRDEPLQVYSFVELSSTAPSLKSAENLDMPQYCRQPLHALLVRMSHGDNIISNKNLPELELLPRGCSSLFVKPTKLPKSDNRLSIVLIEGKEGSGRTSVVTWLKNQATEYMIPTCAVRLGKKDTLVSYALWKKLFLQLMPKDLFLNNKIQCTYVQELLRKVYPKNGRVQGFSALRVLGITCSMQEDPLSPTFLLPQIPDPSIRKQFVWNSSEKQSGTTTEHMFLIISYLLCLHPTLLIVEGLELADEDSLRLLLELGKLSTRSAIVCTTLVELPGIYSPTNRDKKLISLFSAKREVISLGNTIWAKEFRAPILGLPTASLITLENYTSEEIDRMLSMTMGVRVVPTSVSKLVRDFSGGSYFWVREILHFIKEHGAEHFLLALGESDALHLSLPDANAVVFKRSKSHSSITRIPGGSAAAPRRASFNDTSPEESPASPLQKKVDHLLLVRFGNLSSEEQRILRKSSIIGVSFATSVLYALLSPHLQEHFTECLESLVAKRWLYPDLEVDHRYQFAHAHARQIVYELTPPSERNVLHQRIADHLVSSYPDDRTMFFSIWYHFHHCDDDLALQYAVKSTAVMLETEDIFEYRDCLDLLNTSYKCCKTIYDVYVLQQLMNTLHTRILQWRGKREKPPPPSLSTWLPRLLSFSAVRVFPGMVVGKDSKITDLDDDDLDYPVGRGGANEAEFNTKIHLLDQVERFRHFLSNKCIEMAPRVVCCADCGAHDKEKGKAAEHHHHHDHEHHHDEHDEHVKHGSHETEIQEQERDKPKEWQCIMLNIQMCKEAE